MEEAVSIYTSRVAEKLRRERLAATVLTVCLTTNEFKEGRQYSNALTLKLPIVTDSTAGLIKSALQGIRAIYRDGYLYKKAGVLLTGLVPASQTQVVVSRENGRRIFTFPSIHYTGG
jgi:DNA polymerase V